MGILNESPVPETYAGPKAWWEPERAMSAVLLDTNLGGADILREADIAWTVSKRALWSERLDGPPDTSIPDQRVPGWVAVRRDTDDAFLGMVTATYQEVQNEKLVEVTDAILSATDAHYHTAGSLYGGKLVWVCAKVDREVYIKGDDSPIADYLVGILGHDGHHGLTLVNTPTRVFCGNTAAMALENAVSRYTFRHTSKVEDRLAEAQKALALHVKYLDTFEAAMNRLAERPMTLAEIQRFTEVLMPVNPDVDRPFKTERARADIVRTITASENLDGVPMTAYRTLQGVIEYADHVKPYGDTKVGTGADRRAVAIVEGNAYNLKSAAYGLLVKA